MLLLPRSRSAVDEYRKSTGFVFGVYGGDLRLDLRQKLQRNGGIVANVIVTGSPAFRANILPGDVITRLDELPVDAMSQLPELIGMERGKLVNVSVIRDGMPKVVPAQFNP